MLQSMSVSEAVFASELHSAQAFGCQARTLIIFSCVSILSQDSPCRASDHARASTDLGPCTKPSACTSISNALAICYFRRRRNANRCHGVATHFWSQDSRFIAGFEVRTTCWHPTGAPCRTDCNIEQPWQLLEAFIDLAKGCVHIISSATSLRWWTMRGARGKYTQLVEKKISNASSAANIQHTFPECIRAP